LILDPGAQAWRPPSRLSEMVEADEETALLPGPTARDAAGREEPPRCRVRVVAFVLVLVGALALVAAAGRGAADSETHKVANLHGFLNGFVGGGAGTSAPLSREPYGPVYLNPGDYGETRQITPLNGPPAPDYYHKGPPAPKDESSPDDPDDSHHDDDEDDDKPCDEEVGNGVGGGSGHSLSSKCVAMEDHARRSAMYASPRKYQSVTSFFAKILSRPTRVMEMAMDFVDEKKIDMAGRKAEDELNLQYQSG
jgi:hypothetical protein